MAGVESLPPHGNLVAPPRRRGRRSSLRSWRRSDQLIFVLAWSAGLGLCLATGAIVVFLAVKGISYITPKLLVTSPSAAVNQANSGGFLDPIEGTVTLAIIGTLIATPLAVITALWAVEYGRPRWLVGVVESSVELIAGTPDIVIAIFGLALFRIDRVFIAFDDIDAHFRDRGHDVLDLLGVHLVLRQGLVQFVVSDDPAPLGPRNQLLDGSVVEVDQRSVAAVGLVIRCH